ncbi:MAG TPA: hypothetical protein VM925_36250 [Labilithrix sp.]|nr:hypothetical protein [Labilithrix sp.]
MRITSLLSPPHFRLSPTSRLRFSTSLVPIALALATSACTEDAGSAASAPDSAPVITSLLVVSESVSVTTAVGDIEDIVLTMGFHDANGDVVKVGQQSTDRSHDGEPPVLVQISSPGGATDGLLKLQLTLGVPKDASVDVDFWLVDANGNESAKVRQTFGGK